MWFYQAIQETLQISQELADQITSYCIDSRLAQTNSLFFALKGEKVDGHDYLDQAFRNGAIAAVVEEGVEIKKTPLKLIYVSNVKKTLQKCASDVIRFWKPQIIAVTGSLGKTSTKEFLYTLVSEKLSIAANPGNYNSQLTLPLTILNVKKQTDYLLLEMGLDKPDEIDTLLKIAPPTYAILTMIAHVHVGFFNTFECLANEKMKIFKDVEKLGLYNLDMPYSSKALKVGASLKMSYSLQNREADFYLKKEKNQIEVFKNEKLLMKCETPFFDFKSHYNLLAAIAMANVLQVDTSHILKMIPRLKHEKNRLQVVHKKNVTFLSDAYNANLDSGENALLSLYENFSGRKIAVLSEMVDQGDYSIENHIKLAEVALKYADVLIGFGPMMQHMRPLWKKSRKKWAFFLSYSNMLAYISKLVRKGDTILLKGSRKFALERLINDIAPD